MSIIAPCHQTRQDKSETVSPRSTYPPMLILDAHDLVGDTMSFSTGIFWDHLMVPYVRQILLRSSSESRDYAFPSFIRRVCILAYISIAADPERYTAGRATSLVHRNAASLSFFFSLFPSEISAAQLTDSGSTHVVKAPFPVRRHRPGSKRGPWPSAKTAHGPSSIA